MSRAFVKEADGVDAVENLPERPVSANPNFVTAEGLATIEAALEKTHREHAQAQAANDRAALARTARDLRYWTSRRTTAQVIAPPIAGGEVQFGSTVTIERDDGRRQTFRIVGEDEADPARGTLSHAAPLARALFGKSVGDVVQAGQSEAEIVEITSSATPRTPRVESGHPEVAQRWRPRRMHGHNRAVALRGRSRLRHLRVT